MATNNQFGRLIKISGAKYAEYVSRKKSGNLIFADLTDYKANEADTPHAAKLIYANGIEYNLADADALNALKVQLGENGFIKIDENGTYGKIQVLGADNNYITVTTTATADGVDGSLVIGLDASTIAKGTGDNEGDTSLATTGYVKDAIAIANEGRVVDASLSATVTDNKANIKIEVLDANDAVIPNRGSNFNIAGDSYVTLEASTTGDVSIVTNVADTSTLIDTAESTDTSLASSYAVKTYVESKLGSIANALTFEGGKTALDEILGKNSGVNEDAVGNMYVYDGEANETYLNQTVEPGDNVIITKVENGQVTEITVVQKNLTGAVTASAALTEKQIVIGAGAQGVSASGYTLGKDNNTKTTGNGENASTSIDFGGSDNVVATEKGVKEYVEDAIKNVEISADSSTATYIDASVVDNTVKVGAKVVNLKDATEGLTGLADALDVKNYIDSNASKYTVGGTNLDASTGAIIDLISNKSTQTDKSLDSSIVIKTTDSSLIAIDYNSDTSTITITPMTSTLDEAMEAEKSNTMVYGLAKAQDVYIKLAEVEETTASAFAATATSVGLTETFGVEWAENTFGAGTTIKAAIEQLYQGVGSGVVKAISAEEALTAGEGTTVNSSFVSVHASAKDAEGNVTLDSSVLIANAPAVLVGTESTSTGLATDAYVKDSITNALAWEVIE